MPSVYQRKDGRWVGQAWIDGRRHYRYAHTEAEARKLAAEVEARASIGQAPAPGTLTVDGLLDRWLQTEGARLRPKTTYEYGRLADRLVRPALGRVKVGKLTPDRLQRFLDSLRDHPRQAASTYRLLHRAFAVAVRWQLLARNPADAVVPPTYQAPRVALPPAEEWRRLLVEARGEAWWPWLVLALSTGARSGELCALTWDDVDRVGGRLHIRRAGQYIGKVWTVGPPKTASGTRSLTVSPAVRDALDLQAARVAALRVRAGDGWEDNGLMFPGEHGQPLSQNTVGKALARLLTRHGLPPLSAHKLRHVSASLLLAENVPLPLVSKRLGHANPGITARVYSHALGDDALAADAIARALTG